MRYDHDAGSDAVTGPGSPAQAGDAEKSSRRAFIRSGSVGVTTVALAATVAASTAPAASAPRPPELRRAGLPLAITPSCSGQETPEATEGPLFKPTSPERGNFITPAINGVRLDLGGVVYDTACKPLAETLIEFWHCDQNGDYDTTGYSLRGHQYTNSRGAFRLRTIIPRDYWGRWGQRAPHIHTRVQVSGSPLLVTQLYFPDDTQAYGRDFAALNAQDRLFNRACTIGLTGPSNGSYTGTFDFVLKTTV
ncbi:dioxygenase family protein [Streptomyces sp. 8N706]|uniref:dioxygenase family protein n=1 Tax=Streptomyces sp. 8N706 TaxID=3457416 RepID=UPI003FD4D7AC